MSVAAGWLHQKSVRSGGSAHLSSAARSAIKSMDIGAYALWSKVWEASSVVANGDLSLPESRTMERDWVRDGVHIPRCTISSRPTQESSNGNLATSEIYRYV